MTTVVGCDPDLRFPSFAVVSTGGVVERVDILDAPRSRNNQAVSTINHLCLWLRYMPYDRTTHVCVEGQSINPGGKARPNDIKNLALVAGACAAGLYGGRDPKVWVPLPQEWKGSVPKAVHQARTCTRLGWRFSQRKDYCVPEVTLGRLWSPGGSYRTMRPSDWKHGLDAVGLALWAYDRAERAEKVRCLE